MRNFNKPLEIRLMLRKILGGLIAGTFALAVASTSASACPGMEDGDKTEIAKDGDKSKDSDKSKDDDKKTADKRKNNKKKNKDKKKSDKDKKPS
jgi:hypothetical protein